MPSRVRIYDDGGKAVDRYTLVVPSVNEPGKLDMYGFNASPYHPQGFGQFAGTYSRMGSYSHLGKLVSYYDLPEQAQRYVREILTPPLPDGYGREMPKSWPGSAAPKRKARKKVKAPKMGVKGLRG